MSRKYQGLDFNRKPRRHLGAYHFREALSWIFWLTISGVIAFVIMYVFGLRTNIVGNSMEPSIYSGQQILIDRMILNISSPSRNEVIAFQPNGNEESHYYVKRVIGLPGETVQIIDGYIYIDGELFDEGGKYDKIADAGMLANPVTLGEDEYIVLGDNRNFSEDSRSGNIGIVKSSYIVGKVWFKLSKKLEYMGFVR